jgi:hypothetical protein
MRRPGFLEGVGFALAASLAGAAAHAALAAAGTGSLRLTIAGLALGYLLYLLARARVRTGRVTALAAWGLAAVGLWLAAPPLPLFLLLHGGLLWLVRALFFHGGFLAALADLGLVLAGLAAAVWAAAGTASLLLAVWCFFLVQAAFAAIPPGLPRPRPEREPPEDAFERAHRAAEAALRRQPTL